MSPARRYMIELTSVILLYAGALVALNLVPTAGWPRAAVVAFALSPGLASCLLVPVCLRFLSRTDEFHQRVAMEACLVSLIVVGLTSFAYALARPVLELPVIGLVWVWPALIGTAGLAQWPIRLRLR